MPPNLQTVSLKFARRVSAKVMGSLAMRESEPIQGEEVAGILVTHNFNSKIVKPEDLATYTPLRVGSISSKLHVPFSGSIETLRLFLTEMFAGVVESQIDGEEDGGSSGAGAKFTLHDNKVSVTIGRRKGVAVVEWEASPAGDVIADALIALLMHAQSSSASIRLSSKPCRHPRSNDDDQQPTTKKPRSTSEELTESRLRLIKDTLKDQFESVETLYEGNVATYEITTDGGLDSGTASEDGTLTCTVKVQFDDSTGTYAQISVECSDEKLASNVRECLRNLSVAFAPLRE
eukprot:scaffold24664_cov230-Cylindrotheca_fusiformis.AAC.3